MKHASSISFAILLVSVLMFGACNLAPTAPGSSGAPVPEDKRLTIMDSLSTQLFTLRKTDSVHSAQIVLGNFKHYSEIASSGLTTDGLGVWGTFTDGYTFIIDDNRTPGDNGIAHKHEGASIQSSGRLPGINHLTVLNTLGHTTFGTAYQDIATFLRGAGYTDVTFPFTPRALKNRRIDGVLYISSHGAMRPDPTVADHAIFSLWTAEAVTASADTGEYKDDLAHGRLVAMIANYEADKPEKHYAITSGFINQYVSFDSTTFIYNDACWSGANNLFANTCLSKGAATYMGWSLSVKGVDANRISRSFFSYCLGAPYTQAKHRNPWQRPFDVIAILNLLTRDGMLPTADGANLQGYTGSAPMVNELAPTIETVGFAWLVSTVDGVKPIQELEINGQFSDEKGTVTVNGVTTPIIQWSSRQIECKIPVSGPGSAGDVVVSVHGIKSNPVPLTEWRGVFTQTEDRVGGGKITVTWSLHFRRDVHLWRINAGDSATRSILNRIAVVDTDSRCHYVFSGGGGMDQNGNSYQYSDSGDVQFKDSTLIFGQHQFNASVEFYSEGTSLRARVSLLAVGITGTQTTTHPDGSVVKNQIDSYTEGRSSDHISSVDLTTFTMKAGSDSEPSVQTHAQWDDIQASFPPTTSTPGRARRIGGGVSLSP